MININSLRDEDKGRAVTYKITTVKWEYGTITSWNKDSVFVLYHTVVRTDGSRTARTGSTSESTSPHDLEWGYQ